MGGGGLGGGDGGRGRVGSRGGGGLGGGKGRGAKEEMGRNFSPISCSVIYFTFKIKREEFAH